MKATLQFVVSSTLLNYGVTTPRLSIIIPARNEEVHLPAALAAIRCAAKFYPALAHEVIVVLNRCTDRTEAIAREHGCKVIMEDGKNLSLIRNAGVHAAQGELIITVDADSVVSRNMFQQVDSALSNPRIIGGGVMIWPERWSLGILCTGLALLPIALLYRISCGLFFFRKSDFDAIGGFDPGYVSVEDIDFAKRLKAHGARTGRRFKTLVRASIVTSCRKFDRFGDWYFVRNLHTSLKLLGGKDQKLADKVWYDFER